MRFLTRLGGQGRRRMPALWLSSGWLTTFARFKDAWVTVGPMGIEIFGGGTVRASRAELDRVRQQVQLSKLLLVNESSPLGLLENPLAQLQLALELPAFLERFRAIETACLEAAEQYFGAESAISQSMHRIVNVDVPALAGGVSSAAAPLGALKESPIEISRTGFAGGASAPHSIVELGLRLQRTSTDGDSGDQAEFRIERYGHRVIAYIPGTKKWSPVAGSNPLDLTSNVHAIASQGSNSVEVAASERAVLAALRAAQVGAGDEVVLVGHSQGGIIAANIASGHHLFKVAGVVTFGSPIAHAAIASETRVLALEHNNDPVPTLDAGPNPQRENWVTVKEPYALAAGEKPLAVHDLKGYLKLAGEVDANRSVRLRGVLDFLRNFAGRDQGKVEWYSGRRI